MKEIYPFGGDYEPTKMIPQMTDNRMDGQRMVILDGREEQKKKDIELLCKWFVEKFGEHVPSQFHDELRDVLSGDSKPKTDEKVTSAMVAMMNDWFKLMNNRGEWIETIQIDNMYMSLLVNGGNFFVIKPIELTEEILRLNLSDAITDCGSGYGICSYAFFFENGCLTDGVGICLHNVHDLQHFLRLCGHDIAADNLRVK